MDITTDYIDIWSDLNNFDIFANRVASIDWKEVSSDELDDLFPYRKCDKYELIKRCYARRMQKINSEKLVLHNLIYVFCGIASLFCTIRIVMSNLWVGW